MQANDRVIPDIAFIQVKGKLVDIQMQVLLAHLVVDTLVSTLDQGPQGLQAVGVNVALDILSLAVLNDIMLIDKGIETIIGTEVIGVNGRAGFNRLTDLTLQGLLGRVFHGHDANLTITLQHGKDRLLADRPSTLFPLLGFMLVGLLAPDMGFVHFDNAFQLDFVVAIGTGMTQAVKHEPGCLLSDTDLLGQLHGRYALASRDQLIHGKYPLAQGDLGVFENGAGLDGEVMPTGLASIALALDTRRHITGLATGTFGLSIPADTLEELAGFVLVAEPLPEFKQGDCRLGHGSYFRLRLLIILAINIRNLQIISRVFGALCI